MRLLNFALWSFLWLVFWPILAPWYLWKWNKAGKVIALIWSGLLVLIVATESPANRNVEAPSRGAAVVTLGATDISPPTTVPLPTNTLSATDTPPPLSVDTPVTPTPLPPPTDTPFLPAPTDTPPPTVLPTATPLPPPPTDTPVPTPVIEGLVKNSANLRSGPGTGYDIVGSAQPGQALAVVARNEGGDWYQLSNGAWIAAFLVDNPPNSLAIEAAPPPPTEIPTATPVVVVAPTDTPAPQRFEPTPDPRSGQRYGAICRDGTRSNATGRGACSHHGGVAEWLVHP